jgi:hypothetical protein
MTFDDRQELVLLAWCELAQTLRQGGAKGAPSQLALGRRCEVAADLDTTLDPLTALAEQTGNADRGAAVVVDQRAHDPGFVQGGGGRPQ